MPRQDGTGPMGMGSMTGKGRGTCTGVNASGYGAGFGRGCGRFSGRGFGRGSGRGFGFGVNANYGYDEPISKESLQSQKKQLENMLDAINKQIESL